MTPAQGSSSNTRRGAAMNAIAMSISFCWPYERLPAGRCATCCRRNISIISSAWWPRPASGLANSRPASVPLNSCAATIRLSRTESLTNTCSVWNVRPMPRRESSSGDMPVMSSPQNSTPPEVGLIWPRMLLNSVVLPEPLGPMTPTISPGPTDRLTPSTALIAPYDLRHVLDFEKGGPAVISASPSARSAPGSTAVRPAARSSARRRRSRRRRGTSSA